MSTSSPLALTMMMGTSLVARIARQTSSPESFGSIRSSKTDVVVALREQRQSLLAVTGDRDVKALAIQSDGQRVEEGLLVLDDEDVEALVAGAFRSLLVERQFERERRALALTRFDEHGAAVVLGDVAHDAETRVPSRRSRAPDPGRHGRSVRRSVRGPSSGMPTPWSRISMSTHGPTRLTVIDRWPPRCGRSRCSTRAVLGRVDDGVLEEGVQGRDQLSPIAEDDLVGLGLVEVDLDLVLLGGGADPFDGVRDDERHRDGLARGGALTLDAREVEEVLDDAVDAERLGVDALGETLGDRGIASRLGASRRAVRVPPSGS